MPNRDGTGPVGQGSKTGRGVGSCVVLNAEAEVVANQTNLPGAGPGLGRGLGCGRGAGRGAGLGRGNGCGNGGRAKQ